MVPYQILRLDHVAVRVGDLAAALKFYRDTLGLAEVPRPASFTFPGAWLSLGSGATLHLLVGQAPQPADGRHFAIGVSDVRAAAARVEAAGFEARWDRFKIPGIDRFHTADPDRNHIEIQGPDTPG